MNKYAHIHLTPFPATYDSMLGFHRYHNDLLELHVLFYYLRFKFVNLVQLSTKCLELVRHIQFWMHKPRPQPVITHNMKSPTLGCKRNRVQIGAVNEQTVHDAQPLKAKGAISHPVRRVCIARDNVISRIQKRCNLRQRTREPVVFFHPCSIRADVQDWECMGARCACTWMRVHFNSTMWIHFENMCWRMTDNFFSSLASGQECKAPLEYAILHLVSKDKSTSL